MKYLSRPVRTLFAAVTSLVTLAGLTCVTPLHADAPPGRYELRACGKIVYDTKTKLEWQRAFNDRKDVGDAPGICSSLALDGGGWRVPSMIELVSIQDNTTSNPMIDSRAFPNTPSAPFVTSSQPKAPTNPPTYWTLNFASGLPDISKARDPNALVYSRCVRSPK